MARQSSAAQAYDFERFVPKKQSVKPQLKVVEQRASIQTRNFTLKAAASLLVFFIGIIGIILNQVALTEAVQKVDSANNELLALQSEYRILETELEKMTSLNNIEEVITRDLGMTKLRDDQITYVNIEEGDQILTPEGTSVSIWEHLRAGLAQILEYIKPAENTMQ